MSYAGEYLEYKSKGSAEMRKEEDGTVSVIIKKYDSSTGARLEDNISSINIDDLLSAKSDHEARLAEVNAMLDEYNSLV